MKAIAPVVQTSVTTADTATTTEINKATVAPEALVATPETEPSEIAATIAEATAIPAADATKAKKIAKKTRPKKVKRTKNSFRPGVVVKETVLTALRFHIPTSAGVTSDEDAKNVKELAGNLSNAGGVQVDSVVIRDQAFEIALKLEPGEGKNDDQLLSDTFILLNDVIVASDVLKTGLHPLLRPNWTYTIGTFVADQGGL